MPRPAPLACCLTLLLTLGVAGAQVSGQGASGQTGSAAQATVTVQAGDTAYSIARRAGLSVDALLALNGLSSPQLRVGQVLRLSELRVHVVQPGETLYALARRYGVSVDALLFENTLPVGTGLRPGQTLRLPGNALLASAAAPATPAPAPAAPAQGPDGSATPPAFPGVLGSPFLPAQPTQEQPALLPPSQLPTLPPGRTGTLPAVPAPLPASPWPAPPAAPVTSPLPADWRGAALAMLGTPYVYGGAGRDGTDCSGLVLQVFTPLGIQLPRVSADQARVGQPVNPGEWQGGDLVFFDTHGQGRVTHVGIYLGDDTFVNANSYQGRVTIDHLTSDRYWSARYVGARRVLDSPVALGR
ncbi:C40 family peptidase [Deinococcus koreensis]|uniref:Peptidoglycan endopeptidase n=1 Tax=Deinococcus koreensis TaxID=2054903 RepID=A0A2K3UYV7_9DEIO|nr:C40 family peptidase [Deinococcus koreensis]PNY81712.1 peptidoglycan endopeptidase [Deinococcus koreensis]